MAQKMLKDRDCCQVSEKVRVRPTKEGKIPEGGGEAAVKIGGTFQRESTTKAKVLRLAGA